MNDDNIPISNSSLEKSSKRNIPSSRSTLEKRKKKPKKKRFASLRSYKSSNTIADDDNNNEDNKDIKENNDNTDNKDNNISKLSLTSKQSARRASTNSGSNIVFSNNHKKYKIGKRWPTLKPKSSRVEKPTKESKVITRKLRSSTISSKDNKPDLQLDVLPFPGITHHQILDKDEIIDPSNSLSPFPGITHHQLDTTNKMGYGLNNACSMPSRRVSTVLSNNQKSLKQLRSTLQLPGCNKPSKRKYKNLFNYSSKKCARVSEMDQLKLAPLIASKYPLYLSYVSNESKLVSTSFLSNFPNNIKELKLDNNLLFEFPDIKHLSLLKRLYLNTNHIETFSLEGLDNLILFSIEDNKITNIPSLPKLPSLIHLNLRGNKLKRGFSEFKNLPNLELLDISRCMIQMSLEDFQSTILSQLKYLTKLRYLCLGDNPICTQFPELKYIIVDELSILEYFDYSEITEEMRTIAPQVRKHGIDALKQSSRKNKEEERLKVEQIDKDIIDNQDNHSKHKQEESLKDLTEQLNNNIILKIISYIKPNDLGTCCLLNKRWNKIVTNIHRKYYTKRLKCLDIITGSEYYYKKYELYLNIIKNNQTISSLNYNIIPITKYDEKLLSQQKVVIILINKSNKRCDYWNNFYEQLSFRFCEVLDKSYTQLQHLQYAIYEIEEESIVEGIDMLLKLSGGKQLISIGKGNLDNFKSWISKITKKLSKDYILIESNNNIINNKEII